VCVCVCVCVCFMVCRHKNVVVVESAGGSLYACM
jgi:hypothetical protein